jgi:hypothetical protein
MGVSMGIGKVKTSIVSILDGGILDGKGRA